MHLLAAEPGRIDDGSEAIDLQQDPADIVFLSAADTELACLALALDRRIAAGQGDQGDPTKSETPSPTVRAANLMALGHPMSVDLWVETMAAKAKLVVVRLLGGKSYWSYGVEQLVALAVEGDGPMLAFLPGDAQPDAELLRLSTIGPGSLQALWSCWIEGGPDNAACFLDLAHALITEGEQALADLPRAVPIPPAGVIGAVPAADPNLEPVPTIAVMCYRALVLAGDLAPIEALRSAVEAEGGRVLALSVTSLKDPAAVALLQTQLAAHPPDVILNTTGFAVAAPGSPNPGPFAPFDCPVLQVVLSGGAEAAWEEAPNGLTARDIAMNVALPEVDGRILSRAVSFKGAAERHPHLQFALARHTPRPDRIAFVARLAMAWARLRKTAPPARRVALLLANYPNRDGRLGNGVGLDTPEGTVEVMRSLRQADYDLGSDPLPSDGDALIELVKAGVTNAHDAAAQRVVREVLPLAEYQAFLADQLPESVVQAVTARWGDPAEDPFFRADLAGFALPLMRFGKLVIGVQPARGYNIDPVSSYHDPALPPPHGYLAAYAWIRQSFGAHAVIHMGKHGNLEWLPGKALALAETCFPEAVLGPMPHIYPFIVNDPGEGTQAKRRAQAVIIDHLTPPLTRAETYGVLRD
ncbi:MAG: cobaltochelatase subunit CobN, partial [Rhodospirillaceae bacterium]